MRACSVPPRSSRKPSQNGKDAALPALPCSQDCIEPLLILKTGIFSSTKRDEGLGEGCLFSQHRPITSILILLIFGGFFKCLEFRLVGGRLRELMGILEETALHQSYFDAGTSEIAFHTCSHYGIPQCFIKTSSIHCHPRIMLIVFPLET